MKVVIAGAGQVGVTLAKYLREENHDIILIDTNPERLGNLSEQLDIQTIVGSASHPSVLDKAGTGTADIFLAVTGSDEINIVACGLAQSIFNVTKRVARISSSEYLSAKYKPYLKSQGIEATVSPEIETASRIMQTLTVPGALEMVPFSDGLAMFVGVRCKKNSPILGKTVKELHSSLTNVPLRIVAVTRRFREMPLDSTVLRANDDVYFVVDKTHLTQALETLGYESTAVRYIVIFGGGKVGMQLAKMLENDVMAHDVTIVEKEMDRAKFLAEKLQDTLVLNADGLDETLIDEINLKNYGIAITTTRSDENNILLSLLAKRYGVQRTYALIHNDLYDILLTGLGVDTIVDPNSVMVSSILQHVRKGRVKNDYFIQTGVGEILELEVVKTSRITKTSLGRLRIPDGVEIGGIVRNGLFMIPNKDLIVKEGDKVIVYVGRGKVAEVEKLFSVGFHFF